MNVSKIATLLLLLLIAGAVLVLNQTSYVPGASGRHSDGRDAFVENMSLRIMDSAGQPVYRMTAGQMSHDSRSDLLELTNPLLLITRPDGSEWRITAERGEAAANGERVWLPGAVTIARLADDRHDALQITSSDVLVRPAKKVAETDRAALITSNRRRLEAVGLKADFSANRLELRSRVRGRIDGSG